MEITANDEPTEIEADVDKRFSSIIVNLPVRQTGTGTPSPSNPRPFTMWTDVSLYVSDTEEADEPTLAIELPTPMYGGKVDMVRGEIATTYNSKESGTGWEMTEEGQFRCQVSAYNNGDETSTDVADLYAVHYETVSNKDAYDATDDLTCGLATIDGTTYLYVNDAQYTTLDSFATHIAEEVFVFRAHIPMSDVTEPHIVYLPEGTSYVWADAGFVDYTVSGTPPLSLPNSLGKPLKAWEVDVLPKQDLNGYDSPWPAGGGKNLYNPATSTNGVNWNGTVLANSLCSDFIPVKPSTDYTFSITSATNYASILIAYFDANKEYTSYAQSGNATHTARTGAADAYAKLSIRCGIEQTWSDSDIAAMKVQLEQSASATTWTPYSNICPIHGTDKLNVFVEESYDQSATPKAVLTLPQTVYTGTIGSEGGESRSAMVDMGDLTYSFHSNTANRQAWAVNGFTTLIAPALSANDPVNAISSQFKPLSYNAAWTANSLAPQTYSMGQATGLIVTFNPNQYADADEVKSALTGVQLCYLVNNAVQFPLTTPPIPTPSGTATTWATAEDGTVESMSVTYVGKA